MTILIAVALGVSMRVIGVQPWCVKDTNGLACNYETREACEAHRLDGEACVPNPDKSDLSSNKTSGVT